jgi:hypothetical protein
MKFESMTQGIGIGLRKSRNTKRKDISPDPGFPVFPVHRLFFSNIG